MSATVRVGVGGWTFEPWRANFYPEGLAQRKELEYASRQLTSIEINGTYYGSQKPARFARWRAIVSPFFAAAPQVEHFERRAAPARA